MFLEWLVWKKPCGYVGSGMMVESGCSGKCSVDVCCTNEYVIASEVDNRHVCSKNRLVVLNPGCTLEIPVLLV